MAYSEQPILKNIETGNMIEVNMSPFTIGRGLASNFVIPSTVVSRSHCFLEKNEVGRWVLQDTSTNGTYLNGTLIKSSRSPPLKDSDIIGLTLENEHYVFNYSHDDISDEQLCMIADSVLQDTEFVTEEVITEPIEIITIPSALLKVETPSTTEAGPSKAESEVVLPDVTNTKPSSDNIDEMEDELQCSICSEMFVKATTLSCAHTFCKLCIETWKKNKLECPICRCKITSLTSTLVLDNVIEKMVQSASNEVKNHRKILVEERKQQEIKLVATSVTTGKRRVERSRNRAAVPVNHSSRGPVTRSTLPATAISVNNTSVIEVGSSSESSDSFSETDSEVWRDEYDNDDWYGDGIPGAYYGGYGHCFSCGSRGHWRNGCPYI